MAYLDPDPPAPWKPPRIDERKSQEQRDEEWQLLNHRKMSEDFSDTPTPQEIADNNNIHT